MPSRKSLENKLRKTALSATYPAPGVRTYGKSNTDLGEIINLLHQAGYVVDQNLLSHIFNAIVKIAMRDGFCFASKYGLFSVIYDIDREYAFLRFQESVHTANMLNAHFGVMRYHQDIERIDKDNQEIADLFAEVVALEPES
jgi:hypothetical protein